MSHSSLRRTRSVGKPSIPSARKAMLAVVASLSATGFAGNAMAAEDTSLTWNGITLYGVVDIGLAHQTHGTPTTAEFYPSAEWMISKNSNKSITSMVSNPMSQSRLGLRGLEPLSDQFSFVFNVEMGFNPTSVALADAPGSLTKNNGVALENQRSAGDGSRAGQIFNGQAVAGFSSKDYGTVVFGRNTTVLLDNIVKYDPMNGSYALSLIGYSGVTSGMGSTENARLDDSVKYTYKYGMFRVGALYQFGNTDTSPGKAYQANVGFEYGGFSTDAVYGHKNTAISLASLSAAQVVALPTNSLAATISDNTSYTLDASYATGPFKVSGGYEHIKYENPSNPLAAGFAGLGGYWIGVTNNTAFPKPKMLQVYWLGAKYNFTNDFDITGAWYHYDQNAYGLVKCSNDSAANCSGTENVYSVRLDYRFTKRFDVYAGLQNSKVSNGLASGFLNKSTLATVTGFRYQF